MKLTIVALLAGCARFDPGLPIELDPDPSWSATEVQTLAEAGNCWNLGFGTQIFVGSNGPPTDQHVDVEFNEFACWGEAGHTSPGDVARIDICPIANWSVQVPEPIRLISALDHEVGRAASIQATSDDPLAIMGHAILVQFAYGGNIVPAFRPDDARLLAEASPNFVQQPSCAVVMVADPTTGTRCECQHDAPDVIRAR